MEDGQVAVAITAGTAPYNLLLVGSAASYSIHAPSTTTTFTAVKAGAYTLSVTDANGCTAIKTIVVGAKERGGEEGLSVRYITVDPTSCEGIAPNGQITVMATGGSGTYSYSLDDKTYQDANVFNFLPAGTYVVYVKDNATPVRKVYVPNVVLKGKEALSFTAAIIRNLSSAGNDAAILITAKGGSGTYTYKVGSGNWASSGYFDGLGAGTHTIAVKDTNECSVSGTIMIPDVLPGEVIPRPTISASKIKDPDCFGGNNGAVAVMASGGRPPYAYSIDQVNWTGNTTITGLAAGVYTIYVRDSLNRRITTGPTVTLGNPDRLTAKAVITAAVSAAGASDGAVRIDADGGHIPYQYSIDARNTYQYGSAFTSLKAQLYTFYVKDRKGCEATTNILLSEPDKISVSAQVTKELSCFTDDDAEITVTASGGTEPYQYRWEGSSWADDPVLTGIPGGMHTIFVRERNSGSSVSLPVFVSQPMMLAVTARAISLPTGTNADGAIAITASGGSGNYTYDIGASTSTVPLFSGLIAGDYTVTVTDANGCMASASIHLAAVDVIVNKTVINLNKSHRSEVYTVRLASEPAGTVTVTISDQNGYVTFTPSVLTFTDSNWGERNVTVAIAPGVGSAVSGGISYLTTHIQNHVTSAPNDLDYMGITREVIVNITDDGTLNCIDFENNIPVIALNGEFVNSPYPICTSDNIAYVLSTTVNGSGISYRWLKDGFLEVSTTPLHLLAESGVYTVTVMNASGCKAVSEPFEVSMDASPDVPVIVGDRVARQDEKKTYAIKDYNNFLSNIDYKWIIPSGYELESSRDDDPRITMKIGERSSVLRVIATNRNSNGACASAEGRLDIEVRASYGVDVFPTAVSNGSPLRILPKNMTITSIAVINSVGESHAYRVLSGSFPIRSGQGVQISSNGRRDANAEEMQIMMGELSSGHYFVVCYGQDLDGRSVVYTAHIVIKD
jgi:hypothetical protein